LTNTAILLPDFDQRKQIVANWEKHDKAAQHYDQIPLHHFWSPEGSPIAKYIKQGILKKGKEIVEVGCGIGTIAWYLLDKESIRIKCIDVALGSLKHVKQLKLPILLATNFKLPLLKEKVDIVISYGVIHHTPDPELCMKELSRILKPGGHIILVLFRKWSFYYFWFLTYSFIPRMVRKIFGKKAGDFFIYPYCLCLFYIPFWIGLAIYQKKYYPPKVEDIWSTFNDQFLSPNESYHTINEVRHWAKDNNLTISDHFNFCRPGGGALAVLLQKRWNK
jgi:ubiquinone/menaquinone biosynthesis C-methylase UbiE